MSKINAALLTLALLLAPCAAIMAPTMAPSLAPTYSYDDSGLKIFFPGSDESVNMDVPAALVLMATDPAYDDILKTTSCNVLGDTLYACQEITYGDCVNPYKLPMDSLYLKSVDGNQYLQQRTIPYMDYSLYWTNVCDMTSGLTFDATCGSASVSFVLDLGEATIGCAYA